MKKLLILFLLFSLTGCSSQVDLGAKKDKKEKPIKVKKLKASKDKIYNSVKTDDIRCDDIGENCKNHGKIIKYTYLKKIKSEKKTLKIKKSKLIKNNKLLGGIDDEVELSEINRDYNYIDYKYGTSTKVKEIFSGIQFVKELETGDWYELETPATTTIENFKEQTETSTSTISWIKSLLGFEVKADTSTFYPDANPETSTADGSAREGADETFSDNRDGPGAAGWADRSNDAYTYILKSVGDTYYYMRRSIFLFDTSSLGSDTIDSATMSLYSSAKEEVAGNAAAINVYSSNPALNTDVSAGDYDSLGSTALATEITYADWTAVGYNDFTLNTAGKTAINGSGITKLGVREVNFDVANTEPSNSGQFRVIGYFAEETGTTKDPKLVVVHSAGATARRVMIIN